MAPSAAQQQRGRGDGADTDEERKKRHLAAKQMVQRRLMPACDAAMCWGIHAGREWVVLGSSDGKISILCNGAAGASSLKKTLSLWQTIKLQIPQEAHTRTSTPRSTAGAEAGAEDEDDDFATDAATSEAASTGGDPGRVTALAWCKLPSIKMGEHPVDSDGRFCAGFAVGTFGRISIFYPAEEDVFRWELVSVLHPQGPVRCLSWAPEGHHLVSGGAQIVLWSPDGMGTQPMERQYSSGNSTTGSVGTAGSNLSMLDRNHQRLLMARSPMMAAVMSSADDARSISSCNFSVDKGAIFDPSWVLDGAPGELTTMADFSSDGRMFATASESSVEVRVWFEGESIFGNIDYVSLYHPLAVTALHWRTRANASSLHVKPRDAHAPQTLVTLCRDHKVRIWQENDPQTEELGLFVATTVHTDRPLRSVAWLQFINYFEGLRSPFPEHTVFEGGREDFVHGFTTGSPFFHASAHFAKVWGQHQRRSVELRTGPIALESRSSLDWLVGVDEAGEVCMWSVEGLSDSPRRDIHCLPWVQSSKTIFRENTNSVAASPYMRRRTEHITSFGVSKRLLAARNSSTRGRRDSTGMLISSSPRAGPGTSSSLSLSSVGSVAEAASAMPAEAEVKHQHQPDSPVDADADEDLPPMQIQAMLVATARVTQEFDPHAERDPWPSTSVFDINPKNVELVSLNESGLWYVFAELDEQAPQGPAYGRLVKETLCVARSHLAEIVRMSTEAVLDLSRTYSDYEESYWVTTLDADGTAISWPVRSGGPNEEVDDDALLRSGAVTLPRRGHVTLACCSQVGPSTLLAAVVTTSGVLEVWVSPLEAAYAPTGSWVRAKAMQADNAQDLFVIRDADYQVTLGLVCNDGAVLSLLRAEARLGSLRPGAQVTMLTQHTDLGAVAVCAVGDKQLMHHGVLALAACQDGVCRMLGVSESGSPICVAQFNLCGASSTASQSRGEGSQREPDKTIDPAERATWISNSASGKIITIHANGELRVWSPALCHLEFNLESTIIAEEDLGACSVTMAHGMLLGAGMDVIAVVAMQHAGANVTPSPDTWQSPKVLIYSQERLTALGESDATEQRPYKLICSSQSVLTGEQVRGVAWSGRDFGIAVATNREIHLFSGWFRHPSGPEMGAEMARLRRRKELDRQLVSGSATKQLEAVNGIGDSAVGMQLPLAFHEPRALIEVLRAGWVEPARCILQNILRVLRERRDELKEMYGEDEKPPAKCMTVDPPEIALSDMLAEEHAKVAAEAAADQEGPMPPPPPSNSSAGSLSVGEIAGQGSESAAAGGADTAMALFANDDFSFSSNYTSNAGRGAASALFAEDPWESVLNKATAPSSTASDPREHSNSELSELLLDFRIRGLSPSDQLQLNALAGVFDEVYGMETDKGGFGDGIDSAGARYLFAFEVFRVSTKVLVPSERPRAMRSASVLWARDSDCQDALIARCLPAWESTWRDARQIGAGLWIKSSIAARNLAEAMAKTQYQKSDRDPFSCALFYFALGKASVVGGLFNLVKNTKAAQLLANDFSEDRWKTAAVKNAFSLIKQQRFKDAAAFFVLGDRLAEATNVCVRNLRDYQLALFLCKVVEGDSGPVQANLWEHTVKPLGLAAGDPWLTSLANSALGHTGKALLSFVKDHDRFRETLTASQAEAEAVEEVLADLEDPRDAVRKAKISTELLCDLQTQAMPRLTTTFFSLEPEYVRYFVADARRSAGLVAAERTGATDRVVQESMQRAARHHASIGIPLMALHSLANISSGLCQPCVELLRVRLSASALHPSLLRAHSGVCDGEAEPSSAKHTSEERDASDGKAEGSDKNDADALKKAAAELREAGRFGGTSMVRSDEALELVASDLDVLLATVAKCDRRDVLRSLWRVSRASDHLAVEFSVARLLGEGASPFLERLEQVMRSVMSSFISLGQGRVESKVMVERHLSPARRMAALVLLLVDLGQAVDILLRQAGLGVEETRRNKFMSLLDSYARVALMCAAHLTRQLSLIRFLLSPKFAVMSLREHALQLASGWFDYEELLIWDSSHVGRRGFVERAESMSHAAGSANGDDDQRESVEGADDLAGWGLAYAQRMLDVVCLRSLIRQLIDKRDEMAGLEAQNSPQSLRWNRSDASGVHIDFCSHYLGELVQASWPLNWTLLSDLQVFRVPQGCAEEGARRLEAMKLRAFADEEKHQLWKFLRGKEQLRILDATARWTERSLAQERARYGCIPDPAIFCARNVKVVFADPGSLLLSVDSFEAMEGTIVVASEKGTEVVSYTFDSDDELEGGSDDESNSVSTRSMVAHLPPHLSVSTDEHELPESLASMPAGMRSSMPSRPRGRSFSQNELPHFEVPSVSSMGSPAVSPEPQSAVSPSESTSGRRRSGASSHRLPRPRRPHLQLKRLNPAQKKPERGAANRLRHSWSSSAKTLLMVSQYAESLWWGESIQMPLNRNLYGDSFVHHVSSHRRVSALLRSEASSALFSRVQDGGGQRPSSGPGVGRTKSASHTETVSIGRSSSLGPGSRLRNKMSKKTEGAGQKHDASQTIMHVEAHPFLPYYATAAWDGHCHLYDTDRNEPMTHFNKPEAGRGHRLPHATRVRFTEDGLRLSSCDSAGQVHLWNLAECRQGENEVYQRFACHTKRTLDCSFLNYSGSIFATVGQSQHSENLCLWDLSLPPRSCRVARVHCCSHTAAYSVAHLQDQQVLLVGGGNGQLAVFDLRQRTLLMEEEHVHNKAIRSLAVHPSKGHYFGSGSTDGTVKLWTFQNGRPMSHAHLTGMHPTHTFMNGVTSDSLISQRGTTDLAFSRDFLYTCGADGNVKMTPLSSLMV